MAKDEDEIPEVEDADFPGNSKETKIVKSEPKASRVAKEDDIRSRKVKRVVKGKIFRKKKGFFESLAQSFLGEETSNVGHYIVWDVLIPAAKTTIQEMVSSGIEMLLFGEARGSRRRDDRERGRSTVSYGSYFRSATRNTNPYEHRSSRDTLRHGFEDLYFEKGDEAADVLDGLIYQIKKYGAATVADYYDLAGVDAGKYTDERWGWTDLRGVHCRYTRGGYIIDLPRPEELED